MIGNEKCLNTTVICVRLQGSYEPGKRHWLKVKKDYLNEGAMADTADLVVLGAFYGKGSNGMEIEIFASLALVCTAEVQF